MSETKGGTSLEPIRLSESTVGLYRDGTSDVHENPQGPPRRIEGFTVGAPFMSSDAPHNGEMHPDGDELLYLVSGKVQIHVEVAGEEKSIELTPGEAFIVPQGVWHRVHLHEPSQLIHITPGPGGEHRPL